MRKERVLEQIVADLNDTFVLPTDVTVTFSECGVANAFYDPQKQGVLPEARAERCEGEYQQIEKSWSKLLAPHIKKGSE